MGAALGFGTPKAGNCGPTYTDSEFCIIAKVTAYWDRETASTGGQTLVPSSYYGPSMYMRDSFWTSLGLAGTPYQDATETSVMNTWTSAIPASGQVPDSVGGPSFPDESGLYYLIRMARDTNQLHLKAGSKAVAQAVLDYIQDNQVSNGAFQTAAPADYGNGSDISPDSWLDGFLYPAGSVDAYDQGLYVVALEAAKRLGLGVTTAQVDQADAVYRGLYNPQLGYLTWLSGTSYKSPDVLAGDALSLYLYNRPLLPVADVTSTLNAQADTKYGTKDLATEGGGYLPASDFLTLQTTAQGVVNPTTEPAGWYQNGGSWFLWTYLAEYAAMRGGDTAAAADIARTVSQQLEVTPLSKEFQLTTKNPGDISVDPAYPYPLGSSGLARQGFGWNAAYAALEASLATAPALRAPLK